VASYSTSTSITVPTGCKVIYSGISTISPTVGGQQPPTSVTGNFIYTPNPPSVYPATSSYTSSTISSNTTHTLTIAKPKSGLIVVSNQVLRASGNDTSSTSDSVTFNDVFYWGYTSVLGSGNITQTTADTLSSSNIQSLTSYRFGTKAQTLTSVTDGSGTRLIIAYLSSAGNLSNVVLNGAIPILGAFLKKTTDLTITTISGGSYTYRVYVAVADNSYSGSNTIVFT
jgi:hypothetical protein